MNLKKLEMNKLFKELQFIKADYEYKSELVREADLQFIQTMNQILDKNQELKSIYKSKIDTKLQQLIEKKSQPQQVPKNFPDIVHSKSNKSEKVKQIFRQIVKKVHPDKSSSEEMRDLYLKASNYYDFNDILGLYELCEQLDIPYEIDNSDIELIKSYIDVLKEKIGFLEQSYTWKWKNVENSDKNELVLDYIKQQIT